MLCVNVKEFKEAAVLSIFVGIEVPIVSEHACYCLSWHFVDEVWFKLQVNCFREFCICSNIRKVVLVLLGLEMVHTSRAKRIQHHEVDQRRGIFAVKVDGLILQLLDGFFYLLRIVASFSTTFIATTSILFCFFDLFDLDRVSECYSCHICIISSFVVVRV